VMLWGAVSAFISSGYNKSEVLDELLESATMG
jgi:hypothetical protein